MLYWGYIGMLEKKVETTIVGFRVLGFRVFGSGFRLQGLEFRLQDLGFRLLRVQSRGFLKGFAGVWFWDQFKVSGQKLGHA